MKPELTCIIPILLAARKAGSGGAPLSEAIKLMSFGSAPSQWERDGKIRPDTGAAILGTAVTKLVRGNFIKLIGEDAENITAKIMALAPPTSIYGGYDCARLLTGIEDKIKVCLSDGFYAAQDTLEFSLTELSQRSSNSVLCTPAFKRSSNTAFDVFVIMPFADEFRSIYDDCIAAAAAAEGMKVGRGDDFFGSNYVIDDIWSSLYSAKFVIADCTSRNVNVFYELGMAHTLGKNTLILTQNEEDIPFDLRHWRYHVYGTDERGLGELAACVRDFLSGRGDAAKAAR